MPRFLIAAAAVVVGAGAVAAFASTNGVCLNNSKRLNDDEVIRVAFEAFMHDRMASLAGEDLHAGMADVINMSEVAIVGDFEPRDSAPVTFIDKIMGQVRAVVRIDFAGFPGAALVGNTQGDFYYYVSNCGIARTFNELY